VTRIQILPDGVVNRIAAGEVVERPASVVKELVENSLDAGATRIEVELAGGGRSLVRVTDDGIGMDGDDAVLALERHATSKIRSADDLQQLSTLGFRGEALPSIAAVSQFTMSTCADPDAGGVRVTVDGGRILAVEPLARARGTSIEVRQLFHNVPARRKFLYTPETELRHASETVWSTALARPDVAFVLRHGARTLLDVPHAADEADRLHALLKGRSTGPVHRFEGTGGEVSVSGLLASGGGQRSQLFLLVNRRAVRDRLLVGAVLRALREGGLRSARVVLFVDLPPDGVDVNVHPAKAEVRFARSRAVFAVVEAAVRRGVAASQGRIEVHRVASVEAEPARVSAPDPPTYASGSDGASLFAHPVYDAHPATTPVLPAAGPAAHPTGARQRPPDTPFGRLIGQYRSSFLLLEDDQGLVIVDQHVAHERVLFEQILRRLEQGQAPSQMLIEPELVEVDEAEASALPRVHDLLTAVGIEAETFGPDTIRLVALPPEIESSAAREVVCDMLRRATSLDETPHRLAEMLRHELAADLSCRAAIKVNTPLVDEEQRTLLDDLVATDNPYRCPHGRPILLRLSQDEMERRLGRR
jgi:DNA mismatch repair protein MutL